MLRSLVIFVIRPMIILVDPTLTWPCFSLNYILSIVLEIIAIDIYPNQVR